MLREVHIKNYSIIDDLNIEFGNGFNVLTGETGAGKSIIINALSLALGERASGDVIRKGEKEAVIEAFFDLSSEILPPSIQQFLEDSGIDTEDGLILKRIISAQGKNRAYINSSMVNVQVLADISSNVIDVHGQYEHQSLLFPEKQLDLLDAYGGLLSERAGVNRAYASMNELEKVITELVQRDKERAQRLDMLNYQLNEIDAAGMHDSEEEKLAEERNILSNAVHLVELATRAYESLYSAESSCIAVYSKILDDMKEIAEIDSAVAEHLKSAEDALPLLEEAGYFLRDYKDRHDFKPDRLDQVQQRLELINGLKRKYGSSIAEIHEYRDKCLLELEELQYSEEKLKGLKADLELTRSDYTSRAGRLSKKRKAVAKKIEFEVVKQLSNLSMPDTVFIIRIENEKGDETIDGLKATLSGIDLVEFLISPNVGEAPKPLARVASGGELSRVMLALKSILAKGDRIPVLVFDEIDSGIGGKTAETVARKLNHLSSSHQIICITHLPQIASRGSHHLTIRKLVKKERTVVEINRVRKDTRASEIARMLGGDVSDVSLSHARELLKKAEQEGEASLI